jgi:hypothetical protein
MSKATAVKPIEYSAKKLATKEIFFFKDDENNVDQICREVYAKKDKIVHYPTPYKGKNKYTTIKKFTYLGFDGKLPVGIYKVFTFGYGFTKILYPLISYLNSSFKFDEVIIEKGGSDSIDTAGQKLYLTDTSLQRLHDAFTALKNRHDEEKERAVVHQLHLLFPNEVAASAKTYVAGTLTSALSEWGNSLSEFNDSDKNAIKDLFDKLTLLPKFFADKNLSKTKEIIDNKFIQGALDEFNVLLDFKSDTTTLEKKWQSYLKKNSWIFSTLFAQPVILYKDEAYVGGKSIDNSNGKYNDFLIKNGLSNNVSFVEIKTHLTAVMEGKAYRGNDVFSYSKNLSGCISQVLNQRDNFQKEFFSFSHKNNDVQTFNSKALIIIGQFSNLSVQQKSAFELFRSNSKDVEILTFDELGIKIESLLKIMTGKV